jgi:AcrR family transcriptional regulator
LAVRSLRPRLTLKKKTYHHGDLKNALIKAGADILSKEGVSALSLRKVAQQAGVSHAAPYAHFADKQALIAAISTEGYQKLYAQIAQVADQYRSDPLRRLVESSWAYVQFALNEPDHFKVTLSGMIDKEQEYPAFVEAAQQTFNLVVDIVAQGQQAGLLRQGAPDLTAVSVWALIHGLVTLLLENQISHTVLDRYTVREIFIFTLNQITLIELDPNTYALTDGQ